VDQGGIDRGTCADPRLGCHELPLGAGHDGSLDGFDAPSLRGLTDRFVQFSIGSTSTEEALRGTSGAPREFPWDPQLGYDERATFAAAFGTFRVVYGVGPVDIFQMLEEASTGTSGATGRQATLTRESLDGSAASATEALLDSLEDADARGVIDLRGEAAWRRLPREAPLVVAYRADRDAYQLGPDEVSRSELESEVRARSLVVTLTAQLPARFGEGIHRQPLLAPLGLESGPTGIPALPLLPHDDPMTLAGIDVRAGARLFVDGRPVTGSLACREGGFEPEFCSSERVEIHLDILPSPPGLHLLQVQNPDGPLSNELPICVGTAAGCR
jgi:hypothetical protein